jgi:hypothetical protein
MCYILVPGRRVSRRSSSSCRNSPPMWCRETASHCHSCLDANPCAINTCDLHKTRGFNPIKISTYAKWGGEGVTPFYIRPQPEVPAKGTTANCDQRASDTCSLVQLNGKRCSTPDPYPGL